MNKDIKLKKKSLNKNNSDFLYEVLGYVQKLELSKYAYKNVRDQVIVDIYNNQEADEPVKEVFKGGYVNYFNKKLRNAPKKTPLEKVGAFSYVFFALFTFLALFVYLYRFVSKNAGNVYSEGIYLFISAHNLAYMFMYGFAGALLSIFIQKHEPRMKKFLLLGTSIAGLIIIGTFLIIGIYNSNPLKLNMIVVILINLVLAVSGYFLEDILSKKNSRNFSKNI